jgi:ABC-2 type transport system permease protein
MNHALTLHLIRKDWYLARVTVVLGALAGALAVSILYLRNEVAGFVGLSSAVIVLVLVSIFVPITTIVNERKQKTLAFVMSLPISPMQYTVAKIAANLSAFVLVWFAITAAVVFTFAGTPVAGLIPITLVISLVPFVAFCLLVSVSIVVESEFWSIVTMGTCNVSYTFAWYFLIRIPGIREGLGSPVPVWSEAIRWLLAIEIAMIVVLLGLTLFFQSKKRNFI